MTESPATGMAETADVALLQNYVAGRWVSSASTDCTDVHDPAYGRVIARTPLSTQRDVDAAVQAAARSAPAWAETPPVVRAR